MFHAILFDLDGTIIDSGQGITNSVSYALEKCGKPVPPRAQLYRFIGPPLMDSFQAFCGFTRAESQAALVHYREYYSQTGIYENEVYEGVPEMLQTLKGMGRTVLLATSKPEEFALRILRHCGLDRFFDRVCGATLDESRTQKADVIAYALEGLPWRGPQAALMVGDRKYDIEGARAAGLPAVGVTYGYGSRDELVACHARWLAPAPKDVVAFC